LIHFMINQIYPSLKKIKNRFFPNVEKLN
jgi:hypothetical protein